MKDDRQYPAGPLVRWFWRDYVRKTWLVLLAGGFFMAIEGASLGALSYMVRPMFDDVFVAADRSAIYWVAGIVFFLFVGRAIAGMLQRILMAIAARTVEVAMQTDLVAHIVRLDSVFFHEHGPGTLMERVRGDTAAVVGIISQTFSALGRDLIALISLIAVALSIDWIWTLVALAGRQDGTEAVINILNTADEDFAAGALVVLADADPAPGDVFYRRREQGGDLPEQLEQI